MLVSRVPTYTVRGGGTWPPTRGQGAGEGQGAPLDFLTTFSVHSGTRDTHEKLDLPKLISQAKFSFHTNTVCTLPQSARVWFKTLSPYLKT